jgi:hypothetical protein
LQVATLVVRVVIVLMLLEILENWAVALVLLSGAVRPVA